ncbi:RNA polymerase sigma24 factor [Streptomyces eurocidicus]|uniref:RNA polymerase sigma-70 factor (ECF subfamily) n=1 Tax=Streptomyces eurocidicus TaxID=66423 RepID=A0A2N8NX16_STREU|nr:RNA polymerase sigma-70 factor [Streptomyces eurocidicus]MBB5117866.1 RNA polymerase sigma-70 factor (ECF subfamily) [Streptomyces eurocidicus]MBF6056355.1 RNA polymerase sigma-70 factor [Streptomyces eurocidicus]PNE33315.1 RNA polymerase sigma24 factor [Streptomyces eurocidicus]
MAEDVFTEHRPLLFTIAYEMLGSASDAEDVLQESYLRWSAVDPAEVEHPRAYLVRVVTRQALNHLRAVRARREEYVGTWLPEPVRTGPGVSEDAVLAESVSMAMMLVLETLNPTERAVFVLHDVFGYTHGEIAVSIGKAEATVRQIAHRARRHVHARRRRSEPDSATGREVVRRFLRAAATGEVRALMDLLAPDVVVFADGGGKVRTVRRPVHGRDDVARFVLGVTRAGTSAARFEHVTCNGMPAARFPGAAEADGEPGWLLAFEIRDGRITGLYGMRNPDKLHRADAVRPLDRGGNRPWKP